MTRTDEPTIQELFDLTGKAALISGASGWLGIVVRPCAGRGGRLRRRVEPGQGARRGDRGGPAEPRWRRALRSTARPHGRRLHRAGFRDAVEAAGKLDVLVNNGLEANSKGIADVTFEEFARHQANNAGYFALARLIRDHAVERGAPASIVMIGSMYGMVGSYPDAYEGLDFRSPVAYHALKGGTIHLTRHLAVYWAQDNVRVNCLSPGAFPKDQVVEEVIGRLSAKSPMKRLGRPHELKGALLLLASDAGSYITGANIPVEGGWTAW